jgi:hypothetical protein
MLGGRHSDNGALFINTDAPEPTDVFVGGIALTNLGVIRAEDTAPVHFVNGFGVTDIGQLCIAPGGSKDKYAMGLPFTNDGRLVVQLNVTVGLYDSFVGGIRVGPNGGVYALDVAPPPPATGFSNGFSTGFGAT